MPQLAKNTTATVRPALRYRNASVAIEWLCQAFGFKQQLVMPGKNNTIAHAQLTFGNGLIMLGSVVDSEFGRLMKQPDEIGREETQASYLVVSDSDAVYKQAKTMGAKIVIG